MTDGDEILTQHKALLRMTAEDTPPHPDPLPQGAREGK